MKSTIIPWKCLIDSTFHEIIQKLTPKTLTIIQIKAPPLKPPSTPPLFLGTVYKTLILPLKTTTKHR